MFMHFPYSLQYAVVGAGKVEESHTGIQGAEEWEAWSHPKKGQQKHTIPHFSHPCAGHECHPKLYKHIIYDINLFRFKGK